MDSAGVSEVKQGFFYPYSDLIMIRYPNIRISFCLREISREGDREFAFAAHFGNATNSLVTCYYIYSPI